MLTFRGGDKKIIILSQILPTFKNNDSWFKTQFEDLLKDYSLEIHDSLSFFENPKRKNIAMVEYSKYFIDLVKQPNVDALIGLSFGGAILQNLASIIPRPVKVFLMSTPAIISTMLQEKLDLLIHLLKKRDAILAEKTLLSLITKEETNLSLQHYDEPAIQRLLFGFQTLLTHHITHQQPNIYNLYGDQSRLVTQADIFPKESPNTFSIPNAGMRILEDNNAYVIQLLQTIMSHHLHTVV
ncbi:MAG: hypothetical protein U0X71_06585 [Sphingobacteriaceae bacterium]|jgi:hypothetical protein|nr:MAG: hypothetical protein E6Q66_08425 [Pedobacter sp.]